MRCLHGVFDEHVEVAILETWKIPVSSSSYSNSFAAASPVGVNQLGVGEGGLWILVEVLHVLEWVGDVLVEVEVVPLLDVLAVIALAVGQSEQAFLDNGIFSRSTRRAGMKQSCCWSSEMPASPSSPQR